MPKPTVHYVGEAKPHWNGALLVPVDHPRAGEDAITNGRQVFTSDVVSWDKATGRIETLNTIYIPEVANGD